MKKIILLIVIAIFLTFLFAKISSAVDFGAGPWKISIGAPGTPFTEANPDKVITTIFNIVISISEIAFIILFLIGGVMYLTSAGVEEQTVKAKKLMIDAVIGMVIVLASYAIGTWIISQLRSGGAVGTGGGGGSPAPTSIISPNGFPSPTFDPGSGMSVPANKEQCIAKANAMLAKYIPTCYQGEGYLDRLTKCLQTGQDKYTEDINLCNRQFPGTEF